MSDRRINLVLIVAVVVAIGSGVGVFSLLKRARASAAPTRTVVVATSDIADGRVLTAADVRLAAVPDAAVPAGAYTSPDSVVGRVTRIPVLAGEPLVPARLAPVGASGGLEVRIGRGKRAMPVRIEDAAASVVQPNSRVDVILVTTLPNGAPAAAKVILSNKRVLSVGGQMERSTAAAPAPAATLATLELTPAEAERLALAISAGRIQFVLRGYGDTSDEASVVGDTPVPDATPVGRRPRMRRVPVAPANKTPRSPAPTEPAPDVPATTPTASIPATPRAEMATVQVLRRGGAVTNLTFPRKDTIRQ